MPKFQKTSLDELEDTLECWLYFLRQATNYQGVEDLPVILKQKEGIAIAMEAAHNALCNDEIREAIEARRKWERDYITNLNAAVEAGEQKGRAEGKALGKTKATKEIARQLLAMGQSAEVILQATGLRVEDL